MKRALSLILALVLCLSLCACSASSNGLSEKETNLVGAWAGSDNHAGFVLLSSGKALVHASSLDKQAESGHTSTSGTWEVEGAYLIIYYEQLAAGGSVDHAQVYKIISNNEVISGQITYTKE